MYEYILDQCYLVSPTQIPRKRCQYLARILAAGYGGSKQSLDDLRELAECLSRRAGCPDGGPGTFPRRSAKALTSGQKAATSDALRRHRRNPRRAPKPATYDRASEHASASKAFAAQNLMYRPKRQPRIVVEIPRYEPRLSRFSGRRDDVHRLPSSSPAPVKNKPLACKDRALAASLLRPSTAGEHSQNGSTPDGKRRDSSSGVSPRQSLATTHQNCKNAQGSISNPVLIDSESDMESEDAAPETRTDSHRKPRGDSFATPAKIAKISPRSAPGLKRRCLATRGSIGTCAPAGAIPGELSQGRLTSDPKRTTRTTNDSGPLLRSPDEPQTAHIEHILGLTVPTFDPQLLALCQRMPIQNPGRRPWLPEASRRQVTPAVWHA
jgi:hypothetical protein